MKVIEPNFSLRLINREEIVYNISRAGRVCYKSESGTEEQESDRIRNWIMKGHESVIEHEFISVNFIHNRGFSHEMVRHRLASFSQESTRYCNYSKNRFNRKLTFIRPYWFDEDEPIKKGEWKKVAETIEGLYMNWTESGMPAQAARGILPNDIKTEIVVTANLREWRHILKLRTSPTAHPDMRRVMRPFLDELKIILPEFFEDIDYNIPF